jgi:hypothetical protein
VSDPPPTKRRNIDTPSLSSKRKRVPAATTRGMSCALKATSIEIVGSRCWCGTFQARTARSLSLMASRLSPITLIPTAPRRSPGQARTLTPDPRVPHAPSTTRLWTVPRRHDGSWNSARPSPRASQTRRRCQTPPPSHRKKRHTSVPIPSKDTTPICRMGRRGAAGNIRPSSIGRGSQRASSLR